MIHWNFSFPKLRHQLLSSGVVGCITGLLRYRSTSMAENGQHFEMDEHMDQ